MSSIRKRDGFAGEEAIVLPKRVIQQCENTPLVNSLFITDIGYYPRAKYHYRERRQGINQHILIYCVDGKGESTIQGKKFTVNSTDYLIIPAWKKHFYKSDGEDPWTIFWIHFRGSNADVINEILYKRMLAGINKIIPHEDLISTFHKIYKNLQMGYSTENMIFSSFLLSNYLLSFVYPDKEKERAEKVSDNFNKVILFLKENIHRSLTLNEIASVINISPSHFSSKFKEITGYSPIEYFNHLKLQKACQLLRFTQLRISEIAMEVGILDQYYFSRLFNAHMGLSPKEFRNKKLID